MFILVLVATAVLYQVGGGLLLMPEDKELNYPESQHHRRSFQPYQRKFGDPKQASNPIVIVPGDAASRLLCNLTGKQEVVHYSCWKSTRDYFVMWLDKSQLAPVSIDCWMDNMKLLFNSKTGKSRNNDGVQTKVPGFGNTDTVEYIDEARSDEGRVFFNIIEALVHWGYRRGKDIVGMPYDWRYAAGELNDYFVDVRTVIEMTYRYNRHQKVVVISHSMGSPVMNYFYHNYVDQAWKDIYIKSHISLNGAWGGAAKIIKLFSSGYNMNYHKVILPPSKLRTIQRSFTSSSMLFPSPELWAGNEVLAYTPQYNYTLADTNRFFSDIGYPTGMVQHREYARNLILNAPGVEVHCLHGSGVDTPAAFRWEQQSDFPDTQPDSIWGDGDGTVNIRSLKTCALWTLENNAGKRVQLYDLPKMRHMEILDDDRTIQRIRSILYD